MLFDIHTRAAARQPCQSRRRRSSWELFPATYRNGAFKAAALHQVTQFRRNLPGAHRPARSAGKLAEYRFKEEDRPLIRPARPRRRLALLSREAKARGPPTAQG